MVRLEGLSRYHSVPSLEVPPLVAGWPTGSEPEEGGAPWGTIGFLQQVFVYVCPSVCIVLCQVCCVGPEFCAGKGQASSHCPQVA